MTNLTINSTDFNAFDRIQQANTTALKAVNNELVELYWQIGKSIVENKASLIGSSMCKMVVMYLRVIK
jgi:hypothetical protein